MEYNIDRFAYPFERTVDERHCCDQRGRFASRTCGASERGCENRRRIILGSSVLSKDVGDESVAKSHLINIGAVCCACLVLHGPSTHNELKLAVLNELEGIHE